MEKKFKGIIVPLVTPLTPDRKPDPEGLEKIIEYVIQGGVDGIFILGTAGEGVCIGSDDKTDLIRITASFIRGRAKWLVGVTHTAPKDTILLCHVAAEAGADAVVVAPPPYYLFSQEEIVSYITHVAENSQIPLMLYNIPKMTKTCFEPETVCRLADHPGIIGMKDSSGDLLPFSRMISLTRHRPDWSLLIGYEKMLLEAMAAGADGGVLAGANLYPVILAAYYHAARTGNPAEVSEIENILSSIRVIYTLGTGSTATIQAIKYALEVKGICSARMSVPFCNLNEEGRQRVREVLEKYPDFPSWKA